MAVAIADLNRDLLPDIVTANNSATGISVLLATTSGGFNPAISYSAGTNPVAVAIGDVNADGNADLAIAAG